MLTPLASILAATLLNPAFLGAGLAAVAVPILIHLLNRQRFKVVDWAAMEFLLRAMRKNRKRMKLEQWLLLATRCAVVCLIGLALARPVGGCDGSSVAAGLAGRAGVHVLVIDNSLSAAYEGPHATVPGSDGRPLPPAKTHLDQQKLLAKQMIDTLSGGGESVAVLTAARPATAVVARPGFDLTAAKAAVDRIEQSYAGTDLAGAITLANGIADEDPKALARDLVLFSDGTRSAWEGSQADALRRLGPEAAKRFRLTSVNVTEGRQQWNQAVLAVRPASNLVTTRFESDVLASVAGFGAGPGGAIDASLTWTLDGQPLGKPEIVRPDAQSAGAGGTNAGAPAAAAPRAAKLSPQLVKVGGPHLVAATVNADRAGDPLKIDDRRYRVVDVASELKVLVVEGVRAQKFMESSGAFLQLALSPPVDAPTGLGAPRSATHVTAELISDGELDRKPLADYRAVILAGVAQLDARQADAVAAFVRNGGTLLTFMGERVNKDAYNAVMLPRKLLPGPLTRLVDAREQGTPFVLDFNPAPNAAVHRYLESFKGLANTGLDTARVNVYWQADASGNPAVERVLSYVPVPDAGGTGGGGAGKPLPADYKKDPAITTHPLGLGTVIFVSTSVSPAVDKQWNELLGKPAWVQLVHELLAGGVRPADAWLNLTAGQSVEVPTSVKLAGQPELRDDAGTAIAVEATNDSASPVSYRSRPLAKPGVYQLKLGPAVTVPVAVNVAADEADVRTIGNDAVRKALGDVQMTLLGDAIPPASALADQDGRDWAGPLLLGLLALLGIECVMAMRFGHYRRVQAVRA
ncbi:MAG: hypothetical protein JWO31_2618 [Phycisphaerales bacterium]|nr:hypothetical protein [Phycisphaerales bacterium]